MGPHPVSATEAYHLLKLWASFIKKPESSMGQFMRVSYLDLDNAYNKFLKLEGLGTETTPHKIDKFRTFLNCRNDFAFLSDAAIAKIKWLSSPYAETLYKAWKAKHE